MRYIILLVIFVLAVNVFGQSRRVAPTPVLKATDPIATPALDRSVKEMFDEANAYARVKAAEYEQKKVPYSDNLMNQVRREQKQLAAKYAGLVAQRQNIAGEDLYYLGMLHWVAENLDAASTHLRKYLISENAAPDKLQTARSVVVVISAKRRNYADAENLLAEYLKSSPTKLSERARMEAELAKAYVSDKTYEKAAPHAGEAYRSMKAIVIDPVTRTRGIDELLDDGMLLFESYKESKKRDQADNALEDMRVTAASIGSPSLYYYALDNLIKYMIETDRKPLALETYSLSTGRVTKDFVSKEMQAEVIQKLKKREKQYRLMGEFAPEFQNVDQWFPGQKVALADLKGKVVFLDFWATWCKPCLDAFPGIKEWHEDFKADGLVIIGVTRYYGEAEGFPVDNANETEFLKRFKKGYDLPYDFVVTKDATTQRDFGATTLPTAVLIDRKGIIRFVESGTSSSRLEQIRENIVKLLAEK